MDNAWRGELSSEWQVSCPLLVSSHQSDPRGITIPHLEQQRFSTTAKAVIGEPWPIALGFATSANLQQPSQTVMKTVEMTLPLNEPCKFYKLNINQHGIFRVVYPKQNIQALAKAVEQGKLSASDRLGLLLDAFEVSRSGYQSTIEYLELISAYRNETDH